MPVAIEGRKGTVEVYTQTHTRGRVHMYMYAYMCMRDAGRAWRFTLIHSDLLRRSYDAICICPCT